MNQHMGQIKVKLQEQVIEFTANWVAQDLVRL